MNAHARNIKRMLTAVQPAWILRGIILTLVVIVLFCAVQPQPVLAALARAVDWTQCRNDNGGGSPIAAGTHDGKQDPCNWVNGNLGSSNSIYAEGDVVPQRAIQSVPDAAAHYVTFDHSFYDNAKGAYTYDLWATPDFTLKDDGSTNHLNLTPCNDIPTTGTNFGDLTYNNCLALYNGRVSYALPTESTWTISSTSYTYPHIAGAEANALADGVTRNLWISCGQVTGNQVVTVSNATQCTNVVVTILGHGDSNKVLLPGSQQQGPPGSSGGDDFVQMKVTFTTPLANEYVAIWTGGHLAKASYWNDATFGSYQKLGAASASGSSFHERLIGWDDNSAIGNQDNQVQTGAVVPPGSIKVIKVDLKKSSTAFPFTANAPLSPTSFTLCDPSITNCLNNRTFSSLPTGTYTIAETDPTPLGEVLRSKVCSGSTSTFTYTTFSVTITLQPGDTVTCTYTNGDPPTSFYLYGFKTIARPNSAKLKWSTANEMAVLGFNVWRSPTRTGTYKKINPALVRALHVGELIGDNYAYIDKTVKPGKSYYYKLEVVGPSTSTLEWSDIKRARIPSTP